MGAIFADPHMVGVGVIFRDSEGTVLLVASMKESEVGDPAEIEMVAMLRGLQLCIPMGIEKLILESDSLLMVNQMNEDTKPWSLFGNIIKETRQFSTRFKSCIVQHVGRLGNTVAHNLARHAWYVQDVTIWSGSCPDFVKEAVWVDNSM
ncbi:hypothetical protein F2P56_034173 [Juglans regia]|uniref:RNase H type-1 domain-containing protein n=2 Tax=Juglans regia TaxID=51240 RepID=A0A833U6S2_JUGRE|nr:uncharacterized protein LOC108991630 [Juglans regia]KAF5445095.1 hypothetical protein F2P56_034173 [Juglans regia]